MGDRNSFSFKDKGAIVNILVPVSHDRSEDKPVCESKTTSLSLTWPDGQSILKVAQLYGTIDASKTSCERKDNSILVTLHKLGTDKWSSLEASEVSFAAFLIGMAPQRANPNKYLYLVFRLLPFYGLQLHS